MKRFVMWMLATLALAGCAQESRVVYDQRARVWRSTHGDFAIDPITGEHVIIATAVAARTYDGVTYYFANHDHARQFDLDPQRYAFPDTLQQQTFPVTR